MILCNIQIGDNRRAADYFIDGTTRFVCVPQCDAMSAVLSISVDLPTVMQIERDDVVVFQTNVSRSGKRTMPLEGVFSMAESSGSGFFADALKSLRRSTSKSKDNQERRFKVVFRNAHGNDRIVAMFEFVLVDCKDYTEKERAFLKLRSEGQPEATRFTVDERDVSMAKDCPNCGRAVKAKHDHCSSCGEPL